MNLGMNVIVLDVNAGAWKLETERGVIMDGDKSVNALIERGHSVLIIEHNMDVIKCADYVIDLGPEGGKEGGRIVCTGTPEQVVKCPESYTGHYLKEKLQ